MNDSGWWLAFSIAHCCVEVLRLRQDKPMEAELELSPLCGPLSSGGKTGHIALSICLLVLGGSGLKGV